MGKLISITAGMLRRDLSDRNLRRAEGRSYETTFGPVPSVIYAAEEEGGHGNFLPASYKRICANERWRRRLEKTYTARRRVMRWADRERGELDCANSSDALLMNVFCYPGVLRRPAVRQLMSLDRTVQAEFGVQVGVPLSNGRLDRTETDLRLGDCLIEAKLTETGFQTARAALVERYRDLGEVFTVEDLPRCGELFGSYQLIRGVLAAAALGCRFAVLCDGRRVDLAESWFGVMRAVRASDLRSRLSLLTWQELAAAMPKLVREFLDEKYGIVAGG